MHHPKEKAEMQKRELSGWMAVIVSVSAGDDSGKRIGKRGRHYATSS